MDIQSQFLDSFVDQFFLQVFWDAFDTGKEVQVLIDCQSLVDGIELWTVSE